MKTSTLVFAVIGLLVPGVVLSASKTESLKEWQVHDSGSTVQVDHAAWQSFLNVYLDTTHASGVFKVQYGRVTAKDKASLESYLNRLQGIKVTRLSRPEQKPYWINLYNALTVAVILRHYPVKSIRDINLSDGRNPKGPWDADLVQIEGRKLSLNAIENKILRPLWQDSRVHFGLNCASIGCPDLAPLAYTNANTETLLQAQAKRFIRSSRGVAFEQKALILSSLFQWYAGDFGKDEQEVVAYVARLADAELRQRIQKHQGPIRYQYDWALNDAQKPASTSKSLP
jgi:Protein of unknown function, DUF547